MKKFKSKRVLVLAIIFFIASYFFSVFAAMVNLFLNAAEGVMVVFSGVLFLIANWPSLWFGLYPTITDAAGKIVYAEGQGLISPMTIIVNGLGWALVGFIIGLIISVVKGRRRRLEK